LDIKAFVPARDYALSKKFYLDLGFAINFETEGVTEFEAGAFRFLLQNYYVREFAESFMMQLTVKDADACGSERSTWTSQPNIPASRSNRRRFNRGSCASCF
jgi:hypothetical protein